MAGRQGRWRPPVVREGGWGGTTRSKAGCSASGANAGVSGRGPRERYASHAAFRGNSHSAGGGMSSLTLCMETPPPVRLCRPRREVREPGNHVVACEFPPWLGMVAQEDARRGAGLKFSGGVGDRGGLEVHPNAEWEQMPREGGTVAFLPGALPRSAFNVAGNAEVAHSHGPPAQREAGMVKDSPTCL